MYPELDFELDPELDPEMALADALLCWLWKKPSLAFFHESERRKSRGFSALAAAASRGG